MIDFPASPTDGQLFTTAGNGVIYKYSAAYSSWLAQNPAPAIGGTGDFCAINTSGGGFGTTPAVTVVPTVISGNSGGWYNTSTGRYTPPAGRYMIAMSITGYSPTGASNIALYLYKNGTQVHQVYDTSGAANLSGNPFLELTVDANGTDYFEMLIATLQSAGTVQKAMFMAFPLTGMQGPTGPAGVTQTVFFETGAVATGTTPIPLDDTIPQQTEGDQFMSLSITPQSATSKLVIEVIVNCSHNAVVDYIVALFQDAAANALAASVQYQFNAGQRMNISLRHTMTSGTTSATTFKVRIGGSAAGTLTFNGYNGGRFMGGVMASSIVIREVP